MAYVLTDGGSTIVTYPYSVSQLRQDNPNTSFPASPDNTLLAEWLVFPVVDTVLPSYDVLTERVEEGTPTYSAGTWTQVWNIITLSPTEQAEVLAQFQLAAEQEANARYNATNEYLNKALTELTELHPDMVQYRSDLINFTSLPGYPANITWPTFPTNIYGASGALPIDAYTKTEADTVIATKVDAATPNITGDLSMNGNQITGLADGTVDDSATTKFYVDSRTFDNRVIYIEPESGSSTSNALFASAMTTIGSTSLYRIYVGSGVYNEPGPVSFTSKNQLNVIGPDAAGTTSATITNAVSINSPAGNRFSNLRFGNTVGLNIAAGLGTYFNKVQFGSHVTIMGMGGFIIFDECDFEANITIDPTFAGQVYINRSAFSGASALYNFNQPLATQVIISDTTGIPNAGIAKAAYSGIITKKNNVQNLYLNNTKFITLNATESGAPANGDGFVYNSVTNTWAAGAVRDSSKVPLAGGTMTGTLILSGNPTANLHAATKEYVDSAVTNVSGTYVDVGGDTMTGYLTLHDDPTSDLHAATKQYVDTAVAGVGGGSISYATYVVPNSVSFTSATDTTLIFNAVGGGVGMLTADPVNMGWYKNVGAEAMVLQVSWQFGVFTSSGAGLLRGWIETSGETTLYGTSGVVGSLTNQSIGATDIIRINPNERFAIRVRHEASTLDCYGGNGPLPVRMSLLRVG